MNKKKIMLGVIVFLVIIGWLGIKLLNSTQIATEETIAEENATNEILENTVIEEMAMENAVDTAQMESIADTTQPVENTVEPQQTNLAETTPKETGKTVTKAKAESKEQPKTQVQPEPQAQTETKLVAQEVQPEMKASTELHIDKKTEETPSTPIPAASSPVEETKDTAQGDTYVYNAEMTQKIVDIINNNPSEFMKTYGFTVSIDSSIPSLTNQFTFFENRVIEKIASKAGNIRVYAQDHYLNGEYLFTECFII